MMKMSKIWHDTPEDIVKHILSFIILPPTSMKTKIFLCLDTIIQFLDKCNWPQMFCIIFVLWFGYVIFFPPH